MQTFLPYPDFDACAAVLDPRRLGKQRVEVLQILRGLHRPGYGWRHHPAVRMWGATPEALLAYGRAICAAWCAQGHADSCALKYEAEAAALGVRRVRDQAALAAAGALPWWLGDEPLHRSHQSALVRKDPTWYRRWFPDVPDDLPYVWPAAEPATPPNEQEAS